MRTPKNIIRHELIGLQCEVVKARNKYNVGINGRIIDETMKTLTIKTEKMEKKVLKEDAIFRLSIDGKKADIDGNYIVGRPEDRIKKKFKKW